MRKKKISRVFPDVDGPVYNCSFLISGYQAQTIDREYTEMITYEEEKIEIVRLKNYREYRSWKEKLSDKICKKNPGLKDITTVRIKYIGDSTYHYL